MNDLTIFGVDIGVYLLGKNGRPTDRTTFAWSSVPTPPDPLETAAGSASARDPHSIAALARAVTTALKAGRRVAIGFEAPMWLPIHSAVPDGEFRLFAPRFPKEKEREWYLQSGAAATLKAVGIGTLLFSDIVRQEVTPALTTNAARWRQSEGAILVFEAFVTGEYKVAAPAGHNLDYWDAKVAAIACDLYLSATEHPEWSLQVLARASDRSDSDLSVWAMIAEAAGLDATDCRGRCDVVGVQQKKPMNEDPR